MKRRSGLQIMMQLIGLVKSLFPIMLLAIIFGTIGYLCAISLTIIASYGLFHFSKSLIIIVIVFAVLRGIFHYIEQYCNHYIAFKLLALIRHKVFDTLRALSPAKLDGRDSGNLISIITTDIELLEVFYAHTISPIMIAIVTSLIMILFIGSYNVFAAMLACFAYIVVGAIIPFYMGKKGSQKGMEYRNQFGDLNTYVLDSLRGLDETIQYQQGANQEEILNQKLHSLQETQSYLNFYEGQQKALTNMSILFFSISMLFLCMTLHMPIESVMICTVSMMGSFGPVVALSNLSNNLNQTLASGERVLSLLEEKPMVEDMTSGVDLYSFTGAKMNEVSFAYESEQILKDFNIEIKKDKIIGIHGASGCGKSTVLKLFMRFYDVNNGNITINNHDIQSINTTSLRNTESYVTQETQLFHDTIANNIKLAKLDATDEELYEACQKASIHDFIMSLPNGYETKVGELGDTLSGGEKQRIGIARAFLHNSKIMLLDEPTSNLDSLNEGIILKSLKEHAIDKTIVMVSHRKSSLSITDQVISL